MTYFAYFMTGYLIMTIILVARDIIKINRINKSLTKMDDKMIAHLKSWDRLQPGLINSRKES